MNFTDHSSVKKLLRKFFKKARRRLGVNPRVTPQTFSYSKPDKPDGSRKEVAILCKSPTMRGAVHIVRKGGEEWLHSHKGVDGFWMVLKGRVRFYGDGDALMGEFGPMEGIMTPRHTRYRFESVGDGDAELLQILHYDSRKGFERQNHETAKYDRKSSVVTFDARTRTGS